MDFILSDNDTDIATCLLHLANKYIVENSITKKNGFLLLFKPTEEELKSNGKKFINLGNRNYNFAQNFTKYSSDKENMNLVKVYELKNAYRAKDLIFHFRIISNNFHKNGLRLILIDNLTNIIFRWFNDYVRNDRFFNSNPKITERKLYMLYEEILGNFLKQILLLQKSYFCQCFVSINYNLTDDNIYYKQILFNSIFSFARNIFQLSKNEKSNLLYFQEMKLIPNMKNDIFNYKLIDINNDEDEDVDMEKDDDDFFGIKKEIKEKDKNTIKELKDVKFISQEESRKSMIKYLNDFIHEYNQFLEKNDLSNEQNSDITPHQ